MDDKQYRILFSPIEIAGQMGQFVTGLRKMGHKALGLNTFITYLNYKSHILNGDLTEVLRKYEEEKDEYDIFHYFFNSSLQSGFSDVSQLKKLGKKFVMHHWGNDVRLKVKAQQINPFLYDPCNPLSDKEIVEQLKIGSSLIKTAIIQDFELYDFVKDYYPNIFILPLAFDVTGTIPNFPSIEEKIPLIIHAPTQPTFKGTAIIETTLDVLKTNGYLFKYKRIEQMSHEEALKYYNKADIIIDQILVGTYGTFAVEAMALGKPVVAYIRDDLVSKFPSNLPIVSASPLTLYQALIPLLSDSKLRFDTGVQSRLYAEERHDLSKVIPQLLQIYDVVSQT